MELKSFTYGKGRVRVMRVQRDTARHEVRELSVKVMLEGDFADSFLSSDNSKVIATDTIKNIVNIVARDFPGQESEEFAGEVSKYFLAHYPHVASVMVTAKETRWARLVLDGAEHQHAFTLQPNGQARLRLHGTRQRQKVASGISDLTFLKSTGSGWSGYMMDEATTLKETTDRILATAMSANWTWFIKPDSYKETNAKIIDAMLKVFANTYSTSVQNTLYAMGRAALNAAPQIVDISISCPNIHYVPVDMTPFGRDNPNMVFTPTEEPHGQIECTVSRE